MTACSDKDAIREIVELCRQIRTGQLGIIYGCRLLDQALSKCGLNEPWLMPIAAVASETEAYPSESLRGTWAVASLVKLESELKEYEEAVKEIVFAVCDKLIGIFDHC